MRKRLSLLSIAIFSLSAVFGLGSEYNPTSRTITPLTGSDQISHYVWVFWYWDYTFYDNLSYYSSVTGEVAPSPASANTVFFKGGTNYSVTFSKTENANTYGSWKFTHQIGADPPSIIGSDTSRTLTSPTYSSNAVVTAKVERFENGVAGASHTYSYSIIADSVAPLISSAIPAFSKASAFELNATASDNQSGLFSLRLWVDGAERNLPFSLTAEGSHTVLLTAYDKVGNFSNLSRTIVLDRTAPTILNVAGDMGVTWSNAASATVSATASDNGSGIARIEYSLDQATWVVGSSYVETREGAHTIYFRALDNAGNYSSAASANVNLDRIGASLSLSGDMGSEWSNAASATIRAFATDGDPSVARIEHSLDQIDWSSGSSYSETKEGAETVYFRAIDDAGNIGAISAAHINLDRTPPTVAVLSDSGNGSWSNADSVLVSVTSADDRSGVASVEQSLDGANWTPGDSYTETREGATTVSFRALDRAGNYSALLTLPIMIDRTGPVLSVTRNPDIGWTNLPVLLTATVSDEAGAGGGSCEYSLDQSNWTTGAAFTVSFPGVTRVFFRARDSLGNTGAIVSKEVAIDTSKPTITVAASPSLAYPPYSNFPVTLSANVTDSGGSGVTAGSLAYSHNAEPSQYNSSLTISVDGSHSVLFSAKDNAGNMGANAMQVIIDTTAPLISAIGVMTSNRLTVPIGSYCPGADPILTATATDSRMESGASTQGMLASVEYAITSGATTDATTSWIPMATSYPAMAPEWTIEAHLTGLANGLHYLHVRARDAAGNLGPESSRALLVDATALPAPVIESSTHQYAATPDTADSATTALFKLRSSSSGPSGLKEYRYSLLKGSATVSQGSLAVASDGSASCSLPVLSDNDAGEYYVFQASAVSGSGLVGAMGSYQFRVDTKPPKNLVLSISPQNDSLKCYADKLASVTWVQPSDLSGLKGYRSHLVYVLYGGLAPALPAEGSSLSGWGSSTLNTSISIDLVAAASAFTIGDPRKNAGDLWVQVCAEDYAGNQSFAQRRIRYDFQKPSLAAISGASAVLSTSEDPGTGSFDVEWGTGSDLPASGGSGISELSLKIGRAVVDSGGALSVDYSGMPGQVISADASTGIVAAGSWAVPVSGDGTTNYFVSATLRDRAGNQAEYSALYHPPGAQDLPTTITRSYTQDVAGYSLSGNLEQGIDGGLLRYASGSMAEPAGLELTSPGVSGNPISWSGIAFTTFAAAVDGSVATAAMAAPSGSAAALGGWSFSFGGLSLDADLGLALTNAYVTVTDANGAPRALSFASVLLGREATLAPTDSATPISPSLSLLASTSFAPTSGTSSLRLEGVALASFDHGLLKLEGAATPLSFDGAAYHLKSVADWIAASSVALDSASFDAGGRFQGAMLSLPSNPDESNGVELDMGASRMILKRAGIELGPANRLRLHVADADLLLPTVLSSVAAGSIHAKTSIRDFYLDLGDLSVTAGDSFYVGDFSTTLSDGSVMTYTHGAGKANLASSGALTILAVVNLGGIIPSVLYSGIGYSSDVFDFSAAVASAFSVACDGFVIDVSSSQKTSAGIIVKEGSLRLTRANPYPVVENLPLEFDVGTVKVATGTRCVTAQPSGQTVALASDFAALQVRNLAIDLDSNGNMRAKVDVNIPVPVSNFGVQTVEVDGATVDSSGTLGADGTVNMPTTLVVDGYSLSPEQVAFDGKELNLESASISLPSNLTAADPTLRGLTFSKDGISGPGTLSGPVSLSTAPWTVAYESLSLEGGGIGLQGRGNLTATSDSGDVEASFDSFSVKSDGSYTSGPALASSVARVASWDFTVSGASLSSGSQGAELLCPTATTTLPQSLGSKVLSFNNVALKAAALVDGAARMTNSLSFSSIEGISVSSNARALGSGGVSLGGSLGFSGDLAASSPSVPVANDSIRLFPDGSITMSDPQAALTYIVAGWTITGRGLSIGPEGILTIASNSVIYHGQTVELGSMEFFVDGTMAKSASFNLEAGNQLIAPSIDAFEGVFDENGLAVRALGQLPETLGAPEIFFNRVTLLPDGGFIPNAARDRLDFKLASIQVHLEKINLDDSGFTVASATFTLPPELEGSAFTLRGLHIGFDGSFELADADPFTLFGTRIDLDGVSLANGIFDLKGSVTLSDSMAGDLAGKTLGIRDFRMSTSGSVLAFDARYEDSVVLPLNDWSVTATGVGIQKTGDFYYVVFDAAELDLPSDWGGGSATIAGLKIGLTDASMKFDSITLTHPLPFYALGIEFQMNSITISSDFDITLAGSGVLPSDYPIEALRGLTINVTAFQVKHDMSIGTVIASATVGSSAKLIDGITLMKGATLGFSNSGGHAVANLSGSLRFEDPYPEGIKGTVLTLGTTAVDLTDGRLLSLDIVSQPRDFTVFSNVNLSAASLAIHYDASAAAADNYVSVSGGIVLPSSLPAGVGGQIVTLNPFRIGFDGSVSLNAEFQASPSQSYTIFGSIQVSGLDLRANYANNHFTYGLGGTFVLAGSFPDGIKGTAVTIRSLTMDGSGALLDVDASAALPAQTIYNSVRVDNVAVSLAKSGTSDLTVGLTGTLYLPDNFPQGLAGLPITINAFTINSSGSVTALDFGASGISATLVGGAALSNGAFKVGLGGNPGELVCTGQGDIAMPSSMPDAFKSGIFRIEDLTVSTTRGLLSFSAGLVGGSREFPVGAGVMARFTEIALGTNGIKVSATARLPSTYPEGLANTEFVLSDLLIGWDGKIKELAGGVNHMAFRLAGFDTTIDGLILDQTGVSLKSCLLTMPSNFGSMAGKTIGVANARFDEATGKFSGSFIVPNIQAEFLGFTLILENPSIDVDHMKIAFASASMVLPDFVGGAKVKVNGVYLQGASYGSSPSFGVSGGRFSIPDFSIGGGLGFKGVFVDFTVNGTAYDISGGGTAIVPGAGSFGAQVSFTNKSGEYPIGLKRAYFEYTISGLGLPFGTTGLYINGIRGGLAYGKPTADEMPNASLRAMFQSGARLQLGLTMVDQSSGYVFNGDATVWVDIYNLSIAFEANATFLKGKFDISAKVAAALSRYGFYAGLDVSINFVRGHVEVFVFPNSRNQTMFTGAGSLSFGLPAGSIYNGGYWWWGWHRLLIPWSTLWLGGLNAEFGNFTDGRVGFKGFINAPVVGQIGVYVASRGGFQIGGVSNISLVPHPTASRAVAKASPARALASSPVSSGVVLLDRQALNPKSASYDFTLASRSGTIAGPQPTARALARGVSSDPTSTSMDERVIFILQFDEGDPTITATSPSGRHYHIGDPEVEYQYVDGGLIMSVSTTEAGQWDLTLDNLPESTPYNIQAIGKSSSPTVDVATPAFAGDIAGDSYRISGITSERSGDVHIYIAAKDDGTQGREVATAPLAEDGSFDRTIDTRGLADGEYQVYVGYQRDGDLVMSKGSAPGTFIVDRSATQLGAVTNLVASDEGAGRLRVTFDDPNGERSSGYYLDIADKTAGTGERLNLGMVRDLELPGYAEGSTLAVSVSAYDADNKEGWSATAPDLVMGAVRQSINSLGLSSTNLALASTQTQTVSGAISGSVDNPVKTGTAYDTAALTVVRPVEGLPLVFDRDVVDISGGSFTIGASVTPNETLAPGTYTIACLAANRGNQALSVPFNVTVQVSYPTPSILSVSPDSWNNKAGPSLVIGGSGFVPGTRVEFDGAELCLDKLSLSEIVASLPAGVPAGTHDLAVLGPDGKTATRQVTVVAPDYTLVVYTSYAEVSAGSEAVFPYQVVGSNDFDGLARLSVSGLPAGWSGAADGPVADGETGRLRITPALDAPTGSYTAHVSSQDGKAFDLSLEVTALPKPVIASSSVTAAFTGDAVSLYGYGFGDSGTLSLGGLVVAPDSWSPNEIDLHLPSDAATGDFLVATKGQTSNTLNLVVKQRGFTLRPDSTSLDLQPADEKDISVAVTGLSDSVALAAVPSDGITASLDRSSVTPNAVVKLSLKVSPTIANGTYTIDLSGTSRGFVATSSITVRIGEAFKIETAALPSGMTDSAYHVDLDTANADGTVSWTLVSGSLPLGLGLRSGTISGTPVQAGSSFFVLQASDGAGHSAEASYSILVEDNSWALPAKDGGGTSYSAIASPADARHVWKTAPLDGADELITGPRRVFARSPASVRAYEASSGSPLFTWYGANSGFAYAGGSLFIDSLDSQEGLLALDPTTGNERWRRPGVEGFSTDGNRIYAWGQGSLVALDVADGRLVWQRATTAQLLAARIVWKDGVAYLYGGVSIERIDDKGEGLVYTLASSSIAALAADGDGFVCLDATGNIILLDANFAELGRTALPGTTTLSLGPDAIVAAGSFGIIELKRPSLQARYAAAFAGLPAAAKEKLVVSGDSGIEVLNRYDGGLIWSEEGARVAAALASGRVYSLSKDGSLTCYNAPDNLSPPETKILLDPSAPGGDNGYYRVKPTMGLSAHDKETYVESTMLKVDDEEYAPYAGPRVLEDGEHFVSAYSTDSKEYRENDKTLVVRVDTVAPTWTASDDASYGSAGWALAPVTLSLACLDAGSGPDRIETLVDGQKRLYSGPIIRSAEGTYSVSFTAYDRAGNPSSTGVKNYQIDLYPPQASAASKVEPGIAVVVLSASDSSSGVARIGYRLDGGAELDYADPLVILKSGTHSIDYRAEDKAGRSSDWKTLTIDVPVQRDHANAGILSYGTDRPGRGYVVAVNEGDRVYGNAPEPGNHLGRLPTYLRFATYLRPALEDRADSSDPYLSFYLRRTAGVYLVKHPDSGSDMSGWTLVETLKRPAFGRYFPAGTEIYERTFAAGSKVEIPAMRGTSTSYANLVFLKTLVTPILAIGVDRHPDDDRDDRGWEARDYHRPWEWSDDHDFMNFLGGQRKAWGEDEGKKPHAPTFAPLTTLSFGADIGREERDSLQQAWRSAWTIDWGGGETAIEPRNYQLPYTATSLSGSVKLYLSMPDGYPVATTTIDLSVENRAKLDLRQPSPDAKLGAGERQRLSYQAYDMAGRPLPDEAVTWLWSLDGSSYSPLALDREGRFIAPTTLGPYNLEAQWDEGGDHPRETIFGYTIVKSGKR